MKQPFCCPNFLWNYFDDEEKQQVLDFIIEHPIKNNSVEEEVTPVSSYSFIIWTTGIGEIIQIRCKNYKRTILSEERVNTL